MAASTTQGLLATDEIINSTLLQDSGTLQTHTINGPEADETDTDSIIGKADRNPDKTSSTATRLAGIHN